MGNVFQAKQGRERGFHHVVGIRGAKRLGEHIVNARNLHNFTNRAAGDYAGAFGGRLQQHFGRAVTSEHLMRNAAALEVQFDQTFLGLLDGFFDGHGHFASLAHAESRVAMMVADDHERGETQVFAALDDFGDAVDGDHVILQVRRIYVEDPPYR